MTGFAAIARETPAGRVQVTLRSVNHRFLDLLIKAPAALGEAEAGVRTALQKRLTRGRIEVSMSIDLAHAEVPEVTIDDGLLDRIAAALEGARARGVITGMLTASDVVRLPHVLEVKARSGDRQPARLGAETAALVDDVVTEAIEALIAMRETEGQFLRTDLAAKTTALRQFVDELERLGHAGQRDLETRLRERLSGLSPDVTSDPSAVAQEVVRFVARSDVDEEIVRLRGHLDHWQMLSDGLEPCGRKLDFLVQEMNRELNTIGAKIEGGRATETVIAAKSELERVREQVQNVE
jgi:uncharacterized protein (TIGR00255 family)